MVIVLVRKYGKKEVHQFADNIRSNHRAVLSRNNQGEDPRLILCPTDRPTYRSCFKEYLDKGSERILQNSAQRWAELDRRKEEQRQEREKNNIYRDRSPEFRTSREYAIWKLDNEGSEFWKEAKGQQREAYIFGKQIVGFMSLYMSKNQDLRNVPQWIKNSLKLDDHIRHILRYREKHENAIATFIDKRAIPALKELQNQCEITKEGNSIACRMFELSRKTYRDLVEIEI